MSRDGRPVSELSAAIDSANKGEADANPSLPSSSSSKPAKGQKRVEWDEENLKVHELNVLRGEYGTMRIEEPKTPFAAPASPAASDEDNLEKLYLSSRGGQEARSNSSPGRSLTLDDIVVPQDASLHASCMPKTSFVQALEPQWAPGSKRDDLSEGKLEDQAEAKKQKLFEEKRKMHYNMKEALARSRKMIEEEEKEMEELEEMED